MFLISFDGFWGIVARIQGFQEHMAGEILAWFILQKISQLF